MIYLFRGGSVKTLAVLLGFRVSEMPASPSVRLSLPWKDPLHVLLATLHSVSTSFQNTQYQPRHGVSAWVSFAANMWFGRIGDCLGLFRFLFLLVCASEHENHITYPGLGFYLRVSINSKV